MYRVCPRRLCYVLIREMQFWHIYLIVFSVPLRALNDPQSHPGGRGHVFHGQITPTSTRIETQNATRDPVVDGDENASTRTAKETISSQEIRDREKIELVLAKRPCSVGPDEILAGFRISSKIPNASKMTFLASEQIAKRNDCECIGIAEGGARTRDLEVWNINDDKSHTLYRLSYPGRSD